VSKAKGESGMMIHKQYIKWRNVKEHKQGSDKMTIIKGNSNYVMVHGEIPKTCLTFQGRQYLRRRIGKRVSEYLDCFIIEG